MYIKMKYKTINCRKCEGSQTATWRHFAFGTSKLDIERLTLLGR